MVQDVKEATDQDRSANITAHEYYTLVIICLANIVNYMDRFLIPGVLVQVQNEYSINDQMAGLLHTGYWIPYTLIAPLYGYLADRYSRRLLLIISIGIWTTMTLLGSWASTYYLLLATRCLVGIGQSGFTTIAPSVISDIFTMEARSIALAVYYIAIPVGAGLGYVSSGKVSQWSGEWRWALRTTPVIAVVCCVLLAFAVDPKRGKKDAQLMGGAEWEKTTYKDAIIFFMRNTSFLLVTGAATCVNYVLGALSWWAPKCLYYGFLRLDADVLLGDVAFKFGVITVLTGFCGVMFGTLLSKLLRPRIACIDPIICGIGLLISLPCIMGSIFMSAANQILTFILIFCGQLTLNLEWAIAVDILLYIVMPSRRATAMSIQMFVSHIFGDCISPYLVGAVSDHLRSAHSKDDYTALKISLLVNICVQLVGGILFVVDGAFVNKDRQKVAELMLKNT